MVPYQRLSVRLCCYIPSSSISIEPLVIAIFVTVATSFMGPLNKNGGGWGKSWINTLRVCHFAYLIIKGLFSVDTLWAFMWDADIFKICAHSKRNPCAYFFPDFFVTSLLILFLPSP